MRDVYPYEDGGRRRRFGDAPQVTPVNVYDNGDAGGLVVQVPLPGVVPPDLDGEITPDEMTIRAAKRGGETTSTTTTMNGIPARTNDR